MAKPQFDQLRSTLEQVQELLGPQVYAVGGCVRDSLLGKEPLDYDFCTPLVPDEMEELLKQHNKRCYTSGKRFGTIGFKLNGKLIEVTTFRTEDYELKSRNPYVAFTKSLSTDLLRRDFTINAMAFGTQGLVDPMGGQEDLAAKRLRSVGEAYARLQDDPLRSLRAARFCAQLGLRVEPSLREAMRLLRFDILGLSKERVKTELEKILCSPLPIFGLELLISTKILDLLFPELKPLQKEDDFYFALEFARALAKTPPCAAERWAVLFAFCARSSKLELSPSRMHERKLLAQESLKRYSSYLRLSKDETGAIAQMLDKNWGFWNEVRG